MQTIAMTTELQVLAYGVILCLVNVVVQATVTTHLVGLPYALSARDEGKVPPGFVALRLKRALNNYLETFPVFVALALALAITGKSGGTGATGAILWLAGRIVYLPVYAFGIPILRTVAWVASIVGLVMMLTRLMG